MFFDYFSAFWSQKFQKLKKLQKKLLFRILFFVFLVIFLQTLFCNLLSFFTVEYTLSSVVQLLFILSRLEKTMVETSVLLLRYSVILVVLYFFSVLPVCRFVLKIKELWLEIFKCSF